MNFSKQQKLFLHNVLFSYLTSHPELERSIKTDVEDIMLGLAEDLLEDPHHHEEDDEETSGYDDDEEEVYEESDVDLRLDLDVYTSLPRLRVDEGGHKSTLRFYESNGTLCFNLDCADGQKVIVENVEIVTRGAQRLTIDTGDGESWDFDVSKFPTAWTSVLPVNKTTSP